MKNFINTICILILSVTINVNTGQGQWIQTSGPYGGDIRKLVTCGDCYFALSGYDLYVSTNYGGSWIKTKLPSGHLASSLAAVGNYIFAGSQLNGLLRSTDLGNTWTYVHNGLSNTSIFGLTSTDNYLFAASPSSELFVSNDSGENWSQIFFNLNSSFGSLLSAGPHIFHSTFQKVYYSSNYGSNWSLLNNITSSTAAATIDSRIFHCSNNGISVSTNNGINWLSVNNGVTDNTFWSLASQGQLLLAGSYSKGVYISTNYGTNWVQKNSGLNNLKIQKNCLISDNSRILAGTTGDTIYQGSIYISSDSAANWNEKIKNISNVYISDLAYNGAFIFAGSSSGIYKSSNLGVSWYLTNSGTNINSVSSLSTSGSKIYAGTSKGAYKSSDNGLHWISINNGLTNTYITELTPIDSFLYAGTSAGIFRSSDDGDNWSLVNNQITYAINFKSFDNKLYLTKSGVYYSTDNGSNWILSGLSGKIINSLFFYGSVFFAGTRENGIFISNDSGQSWNQNQPGLNVSSFANYQSRIIGSNYTSTNGGQNWRDYNEGLNYNSYYNTYEYLGSLIIVNDMVYAGTGTSVWSRDLKFRRNDVGITDIINPVKDTTLYTGCITGSEFMPQIKIENFGSNNQLNPFSVTCRIEHNSNTVYSNSVSDTISSLQSHIISFEEQFNSIPNDTGVYKIFVKTLLPGDTAFYNDTVSWSVKIYNPNFGKEPNRGAPGDFGYYFANSTLEAICAVDKPVFQWEDTTGSVSLISNGIPVIPLSNGNLDNGYFHLQDLIPYATFFLYGSYYSTFRVHTDGYIYFPTEYPYPPGYLYAFKSDLDFGDPDVSGKNLKYKILQDRVVFTYDRVPLKNISQDSEDYLSFQIIIYYEGSLRGNIIYQYDKESTGASFLNKYFLNSTGEQLVGIDYGIQYFDVGIDYRKLNSSGILFNPGPIFGEESIAVEFGINELLLPVQLTFFDFSIKNNMVFLHWRTILETNNSGFDIERSGNDKQWKKIGNIQGSGNSNFPVEYSFEDKDLLPGRYGYRLKQIDFNGNFEYFNLDGEVNIGIPDKFELSQNYPNPFNPLTNLEFAISEPGLVTLKIYDVLGKEVKTLMNEIKQAGYYKVQFDGSSFSSGVYFYELRSGGFISQKRMLLLK